MFNLIWFRRDLRLYDNAALYHALKAGRPVLPVFIFDRNILMQLEDMDDARVNFIYEALMKMKQQLQEWGSDIEVLCGSPEEAFIDLMHRYRIESVFTNNDYEPYARERDEKVGKLLQSHGVAFYSYKDQVIFEKNEVMKNDGSPYTIFTPYSKKWKQELAEFYLRAYPAAEYRQCFFQCGPIEIPSLKKIGFDQSGRIFPSAQIDKTVLSGYDRTRDFPSLANGTSHLGIHLRFGTISIRELARNASALNDTYLNELIWRDFYQMILWHFPEVGKGRCFKPAYELVQWRNDEKEFERWCEGNTGYPIVDAGMRELNTTGYMHNRVRMITASFLAKHLLIDWRWGEAYFARRLLDFDLAANNGGWQWASGSGCDAAPYFRVFNPSLQAKKFDPQRVYIKRWVPELDTFSYPAPVVEHEFARKRALAVYGATVKERKR